MQHVQRPRDQESAMALGAAREEERPDYEGTRCEEGAGDRGGL